MASPIRSITWAHLLVRERIAGVAMRLSAIFYQPRNRERLHRLSKISATSVYVRRLRPARYPFDIFRRSVSGREITFLPGRSKKKNPAEAGFDAVLS
jgi:hypothetical protein